MGAYVAIAVFAILWIGQLVYSTGKQNKFNDIVSKDIDTITSDIKDLKKWGDEQIKERIAFNHDHFVSQDVYFGCNRDVIRRLESIESYDLPVKLARIETQLAQVLSMLEELKKR